MYISMQLDMIQYLKQVHVGSRTTMAMTVLV